jgi:hypothetical protein
MILLVAELDKSPIKLTAAYALDFSLWSDAQGNSVASQFFVCGLKTNIPESPE